MVAPNASAAASETAILALVKSIQHDVHEMKNTLKSHIETEPIEWTNQLRNLMNEAFPSGDPNGHRRFHEAAIEAAEDRAKFWKEMRNALAKWGLIGFALWLLKAMYDHAMIAIAAGLHIK